MPSPLTYGGPGLTWNNLQENRSVKQTPKVVVVAAAAAVAVAVVHNNSFKKNGQYTALIYEF